MPLNYRNGKFFKGPDVFNERFITFSIDSPVIMGIFVERKPGIDAKKIFESDEGLFDFIDKENMD